MWFLWSQYNLVAGYCIYVVSLVTGTTWIQAIVYLLFSWLQVHLGYRSLSICCFLGYGYILDTGHCLLQVQPGCWSLCICCFFGYRYKLNAGHCLSVMSLVTGTAWMLAIVYLLFPWLQVQPGCWQLFICCLLGYRYSLDVGHCLSVVCLVTGTTWMLAIVYLLFPWLQVQPGCWPLFICCVLGYRYNLDAGHCLFVKQPSRSGTDNIYSQSSRHNSLYGSKRKFP